MNRKIACGVNSGSPLRDSPHANSSGMAMAIAVPPACSLPVSLDVPLAAVVGGAA